jgi:two-component system response regulator
MDHRPILLVEDNPDDAELALHALKETKVANEVLVARDGNEALEILFGDGVQTRKARTVRPSLVLLDLKLPGIDGFDILKRIRDDESTRLMPVVILTSSKEHSDLLKGYRLGANSYVRKPVDYEQFLTAVRQLGTYWLTLNEPVA